MLPEDWKQQLDGYDAIYFGAVGKSIPCATSSYADLQAIQHEFRITSPYGAV